MTTISGSIPNLIGGVSQQPPEVRLENTADELVNAVVSVVSGMRKRPPMIFRGKVEGPVAENLRHFVWDRGGALDRHVIVDNSGIRVFTLDGVEEPVSYEGVATGYLGCPSPRDDIGFTPVADTLFVFNRSVVTQAEQRSERHSYPTSGQFWTVWVENVAAETRFAIRRPTGQEISFVVRGSNPTDPRRVAEELAATLGNDSSVSSSSVQTFDSVISFRRALAVGAFSSSPRSLVRDYGDTIQRFTQLPPVERAWRRVKVEGDPAENDNGFFVAYDPSKQVWIETHGPNQRVGLDPATMPHTLVDNGDGTWTFKTTTWGSRDVGDDTSNPLPSFVGFPIENMYLVRDRMIILADENVIMSAVGDYEQFFRTTVVTLRDDDRIDVAVTAPGQPVVKLRHAVPFNESLLLFSDKGQYRVDINDLAPGQFRVLPSTFYPSAEAVAPKPLGNNILFVDDPQVGGTWAGLRELLVDEVAGVTSGDTITRQCPELVPQGVYQLASSNSLDVAAVFTRGDFSKLFIYSYYWGPEGRIQAAWNTWQSENIKFFGGDFLDKRLHLLVRRGADTFFVSVDIEETIEGDFEGVEVLLDLRVDEQSVSVTGTDGTLDAQSIVTMPYNLDPDRDVYLVLREEANGYPKGSAFKGQVASANTVVFDQVYVDPATDKFLVGYSYEFLFKLSPVFMRDPDKTVIHDGRLQIRRLSLKFHRSSFFRTRLRLDSRDEQVSVFKGALFLPWQEDPLMSGIIIGESTQLIGAVNVSSGKFRFPVSTRGETLDVTVENDSPYQSRFTSIEWEGSWTPKTRRFRR